MTGFIVFTASCGAVGAGGFAAARALAHGWGKLSDKIAIKSNRWAHFFAYSDEELAELKKAPAEATAGAWNLNQKIFSTRVSQIKEFRKAGESK